MYYNDADYAISEEESSSSGQVIIGDNADSEDDAQDLNELDGVVSKKRGIARAYNLIDNFQSLSEAKSCMDALDAFKWKRGKTNKGLECNKLTYKCIESLDCPTLAYILLDNTSLNCSVFKSDDEHQHNQLGKTTDSKTTINKAEIRAQESTLSSLTWESFDDLVKSTTSIWKIELNTDQWQNSKCSCIPFMKHYICKHIIAVANVFRLNTIPEQALQVPLGLKRKRGAPTKARTALIVQ